MAERIIAVDFGTSTSVIRVKRYLNRQPVGDRLETKPVTFNMGATMVPTLVQKKQDTGESVYFGHEAETPHKKTETFCNFKVDIENPDPEIRARARGLTAEFFSFLAKTYRTQSEGSHLGESDDKERTIISYPVKWSDEAKSFMIETARSAGFPNVEGMDEAQAAIQAVTAQNADQLQSKGYLKSGIPCNILLIDMGAGTTDLVLCRYTPGNQPKTDILTTWPKEDGTLFGGREIDDLLKEYICSEMPEDSAGIVRKKIGTDKFKRWKETVVSPALTKGERVDYFSALDDLLNLLEIDADYLVDRASLESFAADYLRQLPQLVSDCLASAGMDGKQVDLVILTGGHSQWYFVREILSGKLGQFGDTGLSKVRADPNRIISISLPQETVALGLTYQGLELLPPEQMTHIGDKQGSIAVPDPPAPPTTPQPTITSKPTEGEKPSVTPESEFELSSVGNCYGIREYIGSRAHVVIPAEIRGLKVIEIGRGAFCRKKELQTVTIPPTIKTIASSAFGLSPNLRMVIAHQRIETIGRHAFYNSENLVRVDFGMGDCPPGVVKFPLLLKSIGEEAFSFQCGLLGLKSKCFLKEVWLSKHTEVKDGEKYKTFPEDQCAVFYYEDMDSK